MKYAVFFLLVVVALAAAAPQYVVPGIYGGAGYVAPGYVAPGYVGAARTLVAGPTVVNSPWGYGGRLIAPGYVGGIY